MNRFLLQLMAQASETTYESNRTFVKVVMKVVAAPTDRNQNRL